MYRLPTPDQCYRQYEYWRENGQPSYMPGRVLPLDGFDDPPTYPASHAPDQQAVVERLRRKMHDVVTSVASSDRGVFQVSLRIFNPDPTTYRRCVPVGAFMPELLPDRHVDDVPTIQINDPEHEEEPMTAAPTMNGTHAARRIESEPEPMHHVQVAGFTDDTLTVEQVEHRVNLIRDLMGRVLQEGEHYGKVPGCGDKMVLLTEKLRVVFGLGVAFKVRRHDLPTPGSGHREYEVRCIVRHLATGRVVGEGMGCCSTMESKYRWRKGDRSCPQCTQATILKSKHEPGWFCWKKKGGCGATFADNDPAITSQQAGRVPNPDLADTYNTVLKIAEKRAAVDATLNATGASDLFTQDLDDRLPDAGNNAGREPFDPTKAAAPATEPEAAPSPAPPAEAKPIDLTRTGFLKALEARGMDGGKARTVYGWFAKQCNWNPTDDQARQFMADIEAGRFDGGEIRPRQQQAA